MEDISLPNPKTRESDNFDPTVNFRKTITNLDNIQIDNTNGFEREVDNWLGDPKAGTDTGKVSGAISGVGREFANEIIPDFQFLGLDKSQKQDIVDAENNFLVPGRGGINEIKMLTNVKPIAGFNSGWDDINVLTKFPQPSVKTPEPIQEVRTGVVTRQFDPYKALTDEYLGNTDISIHNFVQLTSPLCKNQFNFYILDKETKEFTSFRLNNIKVPEFSKKSSNINYGHSSLSLAHNNLIPEKSFTASIILDQKIESFSENQYITILERLLGMFGYLKDKEDWWDLNTIGNFNSKIYDKAYLEIIPGFHFNLKYKIENNTVVIDDSINPNTSYSTSKSENMWTNPEILDPATIAKNDNLKNPIFYFEGLKIASFEPNFSFNTKNKGPQEIKITFTYKHILFDSKRSYN